VNKSAMDIKFSATMDPSKIQNGKVVDKLNLDSSANLMASKD